MSFLSQQQIEVAQELAREMGNSGKSWDEYCAALEEVTGVEYPQSEPEDIDDAYSWFRQQEQQLPIEMKIKQLFG